MSRGRTRRRAVLEAVQELCALGEAVLVGRAPFFGDDPLFVARSTGSRGPAPDTWDAGWST